MPLYRRAGSKHWWTRFSVAGRKTRCSTGTEDEHEAEEFEERERARQWRLYKLGDRGAVRWKEVSERYLNDSQKPRRRDREILKWLGRELDEEAVSAIDADAIEELRKTLLEEGQSHSTVDRFMRTLRAVLRKCVDWQILVAAPKVPMYNPPTPEMRWLTQVEFQRLRNELPPHLQVAAEFAVLTGLRMRAQASLRWSQVDLRARRAWLPRARMKSGRPFGLPLSRASRKVLREAKSLSPNGEHVFQYEDEPIRNFNTQAFKKAAKRAGVLPLRWHDLRHTFASWAVQSGVTLHELMQLGDWSSYQSVLVYAHLAPDHLASAAEKVGSKRAQRRVPRGT